MRVNLNRFIVPYGRRERNARTQPGGSMRGTLKWVVAALLAASTGDLGIGAQGNDLQAAMAAVMRADRDFNQAVVERNRERFLSFVAENATFGGGTPNELRGRAAVMNGWADFFDPNGPTLT